MKDLADKHECMFVDLFSMFSIRKAKLTNNGLHITPAAHETVAAAICSTVPTAGRIGTTDPLRAAISHKHQLWMNYWRPANWKCLYGDDGQREFGKSTAGGPTLRQEWAKLPSMIAKAEQEIWALANDVKEQE